jgi:uncharacterized membrane protein
MTLDSKMKVATMFAIAAASGMGLPQEFTKIKTKHVKPKMKSYVPKMVTSSEQEIADWNVKVDARKQAKKVGK